MEWEELLVAVGAEAVFDTGALLVGPVRRATLERQLARWTQAGRLIQLRRGLYALAPPYQKQTPHPFVVANRMVRGSYVSLESALSYYDLIPEVVPITTSVGARRPGRWDTPLGSFVFRSLRAQLLYGYRLQPLQPGQEAFVALPEKALLDLLYLRPHSDTPHFLNELRLQNLDQLNLEDLHTLAEQSKKPKLRRVARMVDALAREQLGTLDGE